MERLPPAILAALPVRRPPTMALPPVRPLGPAVTAVGSRPKMEILPSAVLAARPIGVAPTRDVIELVEGSNPQLGGFATKKKAGRPSKKEKAREARAAASENIAALLDSEPSKADIRKYFEERIKELEAES